MAGAGLLAHVPTIMLPYAERLELNEGKEISLVPGLERLRAEVFEALDYDTVVVLDSHWHTTVEFVVSAQPTRAGLSGIGREGGTWSFDFYSDVKNTVYAGQGWSPDG